MVLSIVARFRTWLQTILIMIMHENVNCLYIHLRWFYCELENDSSIIYDFFYSINKILFSMDLVLVLPH